MGVSTMTVAKVAVNALVRAIDRIKGATSRVALFPGLCNDHVALVKETSEPLNSLESKLPSIDAYGSTPIQEAMCWGLDSFKNSRARDKLLLVITDGRFNAQYSQSMETQKCRRRIRPDVNRHQQQRCSKKSRPGQQD